MDAKVRALLEMLSTRRAAFLDLPELGEDAPSGPRLCAILDAVLGLRHGWCRCDARWERGEWAVTLCEVHQQAEARSDAAFAAACRRWREAA